MAQAARTASLLHGHDGEIGPMGCDQAQGYLISRPLPAERLARWLENCVRPALLAA